MFRSFPQPVYICRFRFPQLRRPKIVWAMLPSAALRKNGICFVPLSLTTWNISILPSASLHQKYIGFVSLSLHRPRSLMDDVSLGHRTEKNIPVFAPQSHDMKYFTASLSQFALKICRFRFPQPRWPKHKWVSFLSALQPPKKIPLPSAPWPHVPPPPPSITPDLWPETRFKRPGVPDNLHDLHNDYPLAPGKIKDK